MLYSFFSVITRLMNFMYRRFGTLFHLPGVWILYADVSEIRSIFSASEFCVQTLRNTVTSSGSLNFVCRRFGTLFHLPGVWILYADVSEIRSIFSASEILCADVEEHCYIFGEFEFCVQTFRNTVPSSRRLNFLCGRFGNPFHLLGVWIFCADVEEHCSIFGEFEFCVQTFQNSQSVPSS